MRLLLIVFCIGMLSLSSGAQSVKMKIAGVTKPGGEDVMALEVSDTTIMSSSSGGGGSSGVLHFEYLKIKKLSDTSTNELFKRSVLGTYAPDVTFEFYDNNAMLFYQISLKTANVVHFSYLSPECAGCSKLYHQVWFGFQKIEITDVATGNILKWNVVNKVFY